MNKQDETKNDKKDGIVGRMIRSVSGRSDDESPESPSATEMLKAEHDEVRELFRQYESSGENAHATRKRLIDEASRKLEMHAEIEEKIFYPACRELDDEDARKMVGESLEEHLIVKRLIKELRGLDGSDEQFEAKAAVLKESVEHHADEEEKDLFPAAKKELGDEQLEDLGRQMAALKQKKTTGREGAKSSKSAGVGRSAR